MSSDNSNQQVFNGCLQPLCFRHADPEAAKIDHLGPLDFEKVVEFLCVPTLDNSLDSIAQRYREVSEGEPPLVVAPSEERILNKLIWPLRYAKASYMTGNYLGTVALCGLVSEMVAIAMFEMSELKFGERPLDDQFQNELFGSPFEKLGQDRRTKILEAMGVTSGTDAKRHFDDIRTIRKRHLHLWSHDTTSLPEDARKVYLSAAQLVTTFLGVRINGWAVQLHPQIAKYLIERGELYQAPTDDSSE